MVDIFRYHEISESTSRILNPLSQAKLDELGRICSLKEGQRHLDLACGKGEMLCRYAHAHHISGVGVDLHLPFLDAGRARARELGVAERVTFLQGDAADPGDVGGSFDIVSCIGATWIGGGLAGTLELMRRWARPRAWFLVGEVFWNEEPPAEVRRDQESAQTFCDLAGTLDRIEAAGLELVEMLLASADDWDRYQARQWLAVSDWVAAHPGDPDGDEVRSISDRWRRLYLTELRRCMGWGVFVVRDRVKPRGGPARRPPRMHADEVMVDDGLVRRLLGQQFPEWADRPLERLASTGTDNAIYRLGPDLGLRLPRIGWAVGQITKEYEWLPRLAPRLPAPVPEPVALGEPGCGYPYAWLVYRWLDGTDVLDEPVADWCSLARQVAAFVVALQAVDTAGAPAAGARGGRLEVVDEVTRRAISALEATSDVQRARAVWDAALAAAPWEEAPVWVHADLLPGNVLVDEGTLSGVIDWSGAGVGDPACDCMLAWALPAGARAAYREALGVDDATWARGKGWTLQQAVFFIPYYARTIPQGVAAARRRLDAVLADEPTSGGTDG